MRIKSRKSLFAICSVLISTTVLLGGCGTSSDTPKEEVKQEDVKTSEKQADNAEKTKIEEKKKPEKAVISREQEITIPVYNEETYSYHMTAGEAEVRVTPVELKNGVASWSLAVSNYTPDLDTAYNAAYFDAEDNLIKDATIPYEEDERVGAVIDHEDEGLEDMAYMVVYMREGAFRIDLSQD